MLLGTVVAFSVLSAFSLLSTHHGRVGEEAQIDDRKYKKTIDAKVLNPNGPKNSAASKDR